MRFLTLMLLACLSLPGSAAQLIIIIDDMGNNLSLGQRAVALSGPLNFAFLPHTPAAKQLAEAAYANGHGILLHSPMANIAEKKLGPGGLYPTMNQHEIQSIFQQSIDSIPHVQGFNNHMGSLLTQQQDAMRWVMQVAAQRKLFFVDSLTTAQSVAAEQADRFGIAHLTRDVFLDNDRQYPALKKQFNQAINIAQHKGHAVLIGHPYPETLAFLEKELPNLLPQGIQLQHLERYFINELWQPFNLPEQPLSKYLLH